MKSKILFTAGALFASAMVISQVEVDKAIEMTGADGDRAVRNIEAPVNGTDAVNKDYVDAAVSAGGGNYLPAMISAESATTMTFGDALRYCRNLTESTFTDWYMPAFPELVYFLSKTSSTVPTESSTNYFWLADRPTASGNSTAWGFIQRFRLSDGSLSIGNGSESHYVRCVR